MKQNTQTMNSGGPSMDEALYVPSEDINLEELLLLPNDPEAELLRHRFLCRGGALLMVGPTGVGKSVLMMQAHFRWAEGLEFLGIQPARPLRSLIYNAENDDEDLQEMVRSCLSMPDFTEEMKTRAMQSVRVVCDRGLSGAKFMTDLKARLEMHQPDLVNIDPLLHYGGLDAAKQQDVSAFLRQGLGPLIEKKCGAVLVAHTTKPRRDENKSAAPSDLAYSAFGSVEWANFARSVLVLEPVDGQVFRLAAGKRGARLRWKNGDAPAFHKDVKWSRQDGRLLWEPATEEEAQEARENKKSRGKVPSWQEALGIFPHDGLLSTEQIKAEFRKNRWNGNSYPGVLGDLITRKELQLVHAGHSNAKLYGRPEVAGPMQEEIYRKLAEKKAAKAAATKAGKKAAGGQL